MRKRIFEIIEVGKENDTISKIYDFFMMAAILISIIPLWTHSENKAFYIIDKVTVTIFIVDYFLRLITADFKLRKGAKSFVLYPFTALAIIDVLSILPSVSALQKGYHLLRVFRLMRTLKVLRIFKVIRYSKSLWIIRNIFKRQRENLLAVFGFAVAYVVISALVMFNAEPETFPTMFDAIYWATISLTTVGYGDVYAVSALGKFFTMISAVLGIAVVALPAGIIITGYQEELAEYDKFKKELEIYKLDLGKDKKTKEKLDFPEVSEN